MVAVGLVRYGMYFEPCDVKLSPVLTLTPA